MSLQIRLATLLLWSCAALAAPVAEASAAEQVQILFPLGRSVYQTNESIDLSIVRSAA